MSTERKEADTGTIFTAALERLDRDDVDWAERARTSAN